MIGSFYGINQKGQRLAYFNCGEENCCEDDYTESQFMKYFKNDQFTIIK